MEKEGSSFSITAIEFADVNYPPLLREISDPPKILFVRGSMAALHNGRYALAVVGSRRLTQYGARAVEHLVAPLTTHFNIVSGLALGTDGAAHVAALENNGATIAVVGSGVDDASLYPQAHVGLAHQIIKSGGCVLSEYPPGTRAQSYFFPVRNRILAGLAQGVLITEAALDSGTMITARCALDYNRDVFAVPGSIFSETSQGTNELLKRGAKLTTTADDILETYCLAPSNPAAKTPSLLLPPDEFKLISLLSIEPKSIDILLQNTGWDIIKLSQVLMRLELARRIKKIPGQGYVV